MSFPPAGTLHRAAALLVWQGHACGQTVSCLPVSGPSISLWGCHTNDHKLGGLTNRNLLSLEVLDQVVNRAMFLLKSIGENSSLLLPSFWQWLSILGFAWLNMFVTSIPTSVMAWHSAVVCPLWLYMAMFPLCAQFLLSYKDTSHWIRGQPNPIWLLLNLIRFSKTLLPNKATFIGIGDEYLNIPFRDTFFLIFGNLKFLLPYVAEKLDFVLSQILWIGEQGTEKRRYLSHWHPKKTSKCFPKQNHFSPKDGFYSTVHLLR